MNEVQKRFFTAYEHSNLQLSPYYIFGSGGGCRDILLLIKELSLSPPVAIIDSNADQDNVLSFESLNFEDISEKKILISSITYFYEIKNKIIDQFPYAEKNILSLLDYKPNITSPLYRSELAWQEYKNLSSQLYSGHFEEEFTSQNYFIGHVSEELTEKLRTTCNDLPFSGFNIKRSHLDFGYYRNFHSTDDDAHVRRLSLNEIAKSQIEAIVDEIYEPISRQLGHAWQVVNCRVTKLAAFEDSVMGSNQYHMDSLPDSIIKLLIFLTPPSKDMGTTAIKPDGKSEVFVSGPAGTFILLEVSKVLHRGISSAQNERMVCELTIAPHIHKSTKVEIKGPVSHYPLFPWQRCGSDNIAILPVHDLPGRWYNYYKQESEYNCFIECSKNLTFYHLEDSCEAVYLSPKALNLPEKVINKLLEESFRVLKSEGDLILHYDAVTLPINEDKLKMYGFTLVSNNKRLIQYNFSEVPTAMDTNDSLVLAKKHFGASL